jgi:hypothetical protein
MSNDYRKKQADLVFDLARLVIDGKPRRAMRLYCFRCGKPESCVMNTMASSGDDRENRIAGRKFTEMGWSVDLRKGKHFCPECQTSPQVNLPKQQKQEATVAVVPLPRQMGREDRRIVFEKLNEVYVDEKTGYSAPWTDEKVSVDLGVPRAWVSSVREEMFGPIGSNSDIDGALKAASELMAELKKHAEAGAKLATAASVIEKRLDQIAKAVRP